MSQKMIKINKGFAVNPANIVAIQISEKDFKTSVLIGGAGVPLNILSDYTLNELLDILEGKVVPNATPNSELLKPAK